MKINPVSFSIVVGGSVLAAWYATTRNSKSQADSDLSTKLVPVLTQPENFLMSLKNVIVRELAMFSVSLEKIERLELARIIQKILDDMGLVSKFLSARQRETVALTLAQEIQIRQQKLTKLIK